MPGSPSQGSSRTTSPRSHAHAPLHPSGLRESHTPSSPEMTRTASSPSSASKDVEWDTLPPPAGLDTSSGADSDRQSAKSDKSSVRGIIPTIRAKLFGKHYRSLSQDDSEGYSFFRPGMLRNYGSIASMETYDSSNDGFGGPLLDDAGSGSVSPHALLGDAVTDGLLGGPGQHTSTTQWLAKRHGVKHDRAMYLRYYLPVTNWIRQYRWKYVRGDLIAALTMASFYIPMSLSYAANLGHLPPINGLYSFVFNPFVYAVFGTCPQMVVGPEAAGSLLTGQVVRENINRGKHKDWDIDANTKVAGMVTGISGAIILLAGLFRLGFLDSVLSRPFLRGFISAIGIVILVDQLIPEMGLSALVEHAGGAAHGSSMDKIIFLVNNGSHAHRLTCAVSFGAFAIVMVFRELKRRLQPRLPSVAYFPDRFLVVVFSAVLAWRYEWDKKGLDILGDIRAEGKPFKASFPFKPSMMEHVTDAFSTSFLIALLGFFESSVAAKSLNTGPGSVVKVRKENGEEEEEEAEEADGIKDMTVSANRELVALGVANILGGLFMALPAFGGYGRSKVNASTGGKTPMSSVFLSLITVFCTLFLLPYFYYIPKGVLSAMISVVAYSLIEEAPHDLHFFWKISGYSELALMLLIFLTTFFWNLRIGIAVGIGLSLLRLLRHSTRPRIQILGRVPGTNSEFENAELGGLESIPYCLIVKIPEPLTFANTGSLKDRLRRLENHGTSSAHPALPSVRSKEHNRNVVFDVHGVTGLDPAASQVLLEIVQGYADRGTRVFFSRLHSRRGGGGAAGRGRPEGEVWRLMRVSGIVDLVGGESHFVSSVQEALALTERAEEDERGSSRDSSGVSGESGSRAVSNEDPSSAQAAGSGGEGGENLQHRGIAEEDMAVSEHRIGTTT
ncbi:hypothetical protein AAFC00_002231 [Neodothiora populina]|uniref:STAS domain-containing protein n=1 Tax=Neodothiora populina TaxID=2781224 RepID=A0ABR3PH47_9PEZI